ncbi:MAG: hypothetical protein JRJ78_07400 [Deltaproteobacteria bacterium]|nr:hypothetical protein [Deltaproteobacteria bacterium]
MKRIVGITGIVLVLLGGGLIPSFSSASDTPRSLFILHSYEKGHVCGQPQHDGVIAALKEAGFEEGKNLVLRTYYMDTKRKNNTPELIEWQARIALDMIRDFDPDLLVTLDDNAFRTVALKLVDSPIAVIFSGMNGQPEDYNAITPFMKDRSRPGHNITGVYEKLHFVDAVKVHARLFPGLRKVRVLVDPSPTGKAIMNQVRKEISREPLPCAWDMKLVKSWEAYRNTILSTNEDPEIGAIYPAALLLKDARGKTYTAPEIFAWTARHSRRPEIAVNYDFTRMGLFGGAAVDFFYMGKQAGRMAVRCLRGEDPGTIPIEDAERYALVFNLDRARQLGIHIPPDVLMAADEVVQAGR